MGTFNTSYEDVNNIEWDLRVEFSYYAGCKGRTEGGVQMDPDDEEELLIEGVERFQWMPSGKMEWVVFNPEGLDLDLDQLARDYMSDCDGP